ncbi:hypothetical protein ACFFRR_003786 [Megaselia abdita]
MSSKRYCLEIILLYLLLLVPWPQNKNVVKLFCSKDNSRLVRKIIKAKWTPILEKYQVKFPLECPLHPLRDIFGPRQDAKKRHRPTQWTCKLCGKSFYQEKFVDNHFDARHKHLINKAEDSVCLSEFCDIMRCDVFQSEESKLSGSDSAISTDIEVWGASAFGKLSSSSALVKANNHNLSPIRDSTVLTGGSKKHQNRHVCPEQVISQTNSNSKNAKESPDPKKAEPSTQADTKNDSTKEEQEVNLNSSKNDSPTADATIENYINMSKIKASCQSEELAKLKTKCEFLVRSCVGSLLLRMSDEKFKEMEAELNKAICWYLSCERYWEDGPLEPRAFPWGLMVIVIFVLSLGTCFCYYIIWILFDSYQQSRRPKQSTYISATSTNKAISSRLSSSGPSATGTPHRPIVRLSSQPEIYSPTPYSIEYYGDDGDFFYE